MMLGSPIPVQLPYDASEDRLIVRRQNKLARDIDIIQQKIRNNVYSAAEGNQKIQFKRAEIAQLQKYRGSKRVDTGRLSPAPKTRGLFKKKKASTKPSNKYNPYAEDKVGKGTEPTGMFSMDQVQYNRANPETRSTAWAEDDRAGMTSKDNQRKTGRGVPEPNNRSALNQRGYSPANYYSRYVENYQRRNISKNSWDTGLRKTIPINMKKAFESDAERAWRANKPLPNLVPFKGDKVKDEAKSTFDKVKEEAGSFMDKATSLFKSTKSSKSSKSSKSKTLDDNPFGFRQRTKPTFPASIAWKAGGEKKYNGYYYIPKSGKVSQFVDWNNRNLTSGSGLVKNAAPHPKETKTVKDNPYGKSYGTKLDYMEAMETGGKAIKYGGRYYGPRTTRDLDRWVRWNRDNLEKKDAPSSKDAAEAARNLFKSAWGGAGFAGMPDFMTQQRARANRETALMRKRAGARIRFDNPRMTNATQMRSWETYAKPEEVAMIKAMLPKMTGLEKFPELTPEGNAMMIELVRVGTDPQKMQMAANKLATDLVNKSGYFVKKYNVEVDPMQSKVKVSEMSGFAGGLTKTRNSMQRLLK